MAIRPPFLLASLSLGVIHSRHNGGESLVPSCYSLGIPPTTTTYTLLWTHGWGWRTWNPSWFLALLSNAWAAVSADRKPPLTYPGFTWRTVACPLTWLHSHLQWGPQSRNVYTAMPGVDL